MTPSFWPLYHIPGLTGLSIKRTLGLILALSGKNTLKEEREIMYVVFSLDVYLVITIQNVFIGVL